MSSNLAFGLAWWLVAGFYALLASHASTPIGLGLSVAFGVGCVGAAVAYQTRWARERAGRIVN